RDGLGDRARGAPAAIAAAAHRHIRGAFVGRRGMALDKITAAAVQAAPVYLDRDATVDKAVALIEEAGRSGAALLVCGEAFVAGCPDWAWRTNPWHDGRWFARLVDQAVVVPSDATDWLGEAARRAGAYVAIGIDERDPHGSTIYNSLLYLGPDGRVL